MATTTTPRRWPQGRCSKGRSGELGMWRADPNRVRPCCPFQEEGMGSSVGLDLSRLPSLSRSGQSLQEMEGLVGRAHQSFPLKVGIFVTCAQREGNSPVLQPCPPLCN